MQTGHTTVATSGNTSDAEYAAYVTRMQARFTARAERGPLFTTDADLWPLYLAAMPEASRQYHTCHACKDFITRYGTLVAIEEDGVTVPAIWALADAPDEYRDAVEAMMNALARSKVTGVFRSEETVWGKPVTGAWSHFAVTPPASHVYRRTAGQAMAEKREEFGIVSRALSEWTEPQITQALTLLRTDALYRSEKVLGQAEWLHALHVARAGVHGSRKANVVWRAVASAPAGFCHPRASMIGTLLDDIASGADFSEVSRRFREKMSPLQYQRPTAAPTSGAIAAAEKIVADLGIAPSFARRYARLDDIEAVWRAPEIASAPAGGGVFAHLTPNGGAKAPDLQAPATKITWEKFARTVLPHATALEVLAPSSGNYTALVTATNMDAPPIMQWDRAERRNPVTWYVYHNGSSASQWGVAPGWARVTAAALGPNQWHDAQFDHQGKRVVFIIDGAKDSREANLCLFPELLRADLRSVRSVIEAHSRSQKITGREDASACGLVFHNGSPVDVRVSTGSAPRVVYRIDRWD